MTGMTVIRTAGNKQILAEKPYDNDHCTCVLAHVGGYHPYVTWVHNRETGGYYWGHYFQTYDEALKDFNSR